MLHLRLRVPPDLTGSVRGLLLEDDTVTNVLVVPNAYAKPEGCLVMADVARENANSILAALRRLDLERQGSIAITEGDTIISDAAKHAERTAPGTPVDGVVWDLIEDQVRGDIRLSFSFVAFLTLATLIAGVGRLLDEPILIVGSMVVGPEFAPVAAICFALARPRLSLLPRALATLATGFVVAVVVSSLVWNVVYRLGGFGTHLLEHRPLTDFIVQPDAWSFVIAVLAGSAGVLSMTTSKSATLVGVFISVTTVPAVGTLALGIATLSGTDISMSLVQLGVNLVGLIIAGSVTLFLQRVFWQRVRHHLPAAAGHQSGGQPARS